MRRSKVEGWRQGSSGTGEEQGGKRREARSRSRRRSSSRSRSRSYAWRREYRQERFSSRPSRWETKEDETERLKSRVGEMEVKMKALGVKESGSLEVKTGRSLSGQGKF